MSGVVLDASAILALAGRDAAPAYTADRAWQGVADDAGVAVVVIR